jgi:hypothetical protein
MMHVARLGVMTRPNRSTLFWKAALSLSGARSESIPLIRMISTTWSLISN